MSPLKAVLGSVQTSLVILVQLRPNKHLCSHMQSCQQIWHLQTSWGALLAQELQDQKKTKQKALVDRISPTVQDYLLFPGLLLQTREQRRTVTYFELEERYSLALRGASRLPVALSVFVLRYFGACSYLRRTVSYMLSRVFLGDLEHLRGV